MNKLFNEDCENWLKHWIAIMKEISNMKVEFNKKIESPKKI